MTNELLDKPLLMCTLGDFIKALRMTEEAQERSTYTSDDYAFGVKGICELCGCGWNAARKRVENMGLLIKQGKTVMVNKNEYFKKLNQ